MTETTIAAKQLASLALPNACPRCFWIKYHQKKLPWDHFPSVFQALDKAGKLAIEEWWKSGSTPPWLWSLGEWTSVTKPPHWSKFFFVHGNLKVRGIADLIVGRETGLLIGDLKTATWTEKQDELLPLYEIQLNAYAIAAESTGLGKVDALALVYCQPQAEGSHPDMLREFGYAVHFQAKVIEVERNDQKVFELCDRAFDIISKPIPDPAENCNDCRLVEELFTLIGRTS